MCLYIQFMDDQCLQMDLEKVRIQFSQGEFRFIRLQTHTHTHIDLNHLFF